MKQPVPIYKPVQDALVEYQKARVLFVNSVNELLGKGDPGIDAALLEGQLLPILYKPLVQDVVPSVQVAALGAMKTLTANTEKSGDELTAPETLQKVVSSLSHDNRRVIVSGTCTLQSMAAKKEAHAAAIVESGALVPLRALLESFDVEVKESAVKAMTCQPYMTAVAAAGETHMEALLDDATLESLVVNMNAGDSPITLRTAIARFFDVCCAYGATPAARIMGSGATASVAALARDSASALAAGGASPKARAVAFACLATMARHADDLAALVVESGAVPDALAALIDPEQSTVREAAAAMAREIASKTPELAEVGPLYTGLYTLLNSLDLSA